MKTTNILMVLLFGFTLSLSAQFKIQSNGEAVLWTNNNGPWDNTFMTYPNNDYSKCYIAQRPFNQSRFYYFKN